MRIAITTTSFGSHDDSPLRLLGEAGVEVARNETGRTLGPEEIVQVCGGCEGIVAGTEKHSRATLETLKAAGLRAISRVGVGTDNIDLDAARDLGIAVFNTPYGPTLAVAELTVGLMLDLLRGISRMDREIRVGTWKKRTGNLLVGKRVGIVGFGRIGRKVAELVLCFGTEVGFFDVNDLECGLDCTRMNMDDLLAWADIVSVHCSAEQGCPPVIGARELRLMKAGALLVNVSRGGLVDEEALRVALASGHLAGAALDVFQNEPYAGPLTGLDNTVLTPHIGSYAAESRVGMEMDAVRNLLEGLGL